MGAELLDIEAKLDTSQVQGQLNQLSKTSGLQNLDRAIKTLENSMKKLSATMERQSRQANTGDTLLGRNGSLLGRQSVVRGLGIYWLGSQMSKNSDMLGGSQTTAGGVAKVFGGALTGAAFGPLGMAAGAWVSAMKVWKDRIDASREAMDKYIDSQLKAQAAIDKMYESLKPAAEALKTQAMSKAMSPEQRQKEIDRLSEARTEANRQFIGAMQNAEALEGPAYDAAVETAKYWKDAADKIDAQLRILEEDQNGYVQSLKRQEAAAKKMEEAERSLAEFRERVKTGFGTDIRSEKHRQSLEAINNSFGESRESIRGNAFTAAAQLQQARQQYSSTLQEAMNSDAPEQFIDKLADMKLTVSELEDVLEAWQSKIEEQTEQFSLQAALGAVGSMNALERSGYFTAAGSKDLTIENLVQQILVYTRQITANTRETTSTDPQTFGT